MVLARLALLAVRTVTLHAEPILWTLRLYDEPDGYERRLPYRAVCTVFVHGRTAEISAMHGIFDRPSWRAVEAWLRGIGVEVLGKVRILT